MVYIVFILLLSACAQTYRQQAAQSELTQVVVAGQKSQQIPIYRQSIVTPTGYNYSIKETFKPVAFFAPERQDALADHLPVQAEFYLKETK